jgi:hypothetical protein
VTTGDFNDLQTKVALIGSQLGLVRGLRRAPIPIHTLF